MTAMTFESIGTSPRRAAVRRIHRPAPRLVLVESSPATIAEIRPRGKTGAGSRAKFGLIGLTALTLVLHAAIISGLNRPGQIEALKFPKERLVLEIAPPQEIPPPPPPVVQHKPQPQAAKPAPRVAALPAPVLPVVSEASSDTAAADTVQVATAPPPPAPVSTPVEKVTEPRGYAGYLRNPVPDYPAAAQKRGLEGQVVLKVHVLASGLPDNVTVSKSSGHNILDDAAVKAVTAWMFQPAKRGQTAIDGWVQVPLTFKL